MIRTINTFIFIMIAYLIIIILSSINNSNHPPKQVHQQIYSSYNISSVSACTMAGGIIKSRHIEETTKKYKRKDCPICKGKGWYMSGDNIKKIDCQYCEPESNNKNSDLSKLPLELVPKH